ncbi:TauD/TfdA family dioxygenase [Bradyrhizobium sp. AZCC 2262]|uniref:TauD/TfdA family dioxygenase n=1 Tax=Bradyrhizobium sp. AZCC 2262 TaxID=3117022 RepID=UPI003FA5F256
MTRPLSDRNKLDLNRALTEHGVIFIRNQALNFAQHVELARIFGNPIQEHLSAVGERAGLSHQLCPVHVRNLEDVCGHHHPVAARAGVEPGARAGGTSAHRLERRGVKAHVSARRRK